MRKYFISKKGFTILEMLTVVIIIGILAALAVPNFDSSIKKIRFKSATNTVMAGLRLARSHAISKNVQTGVNFDVNSNTVSAFVDRVNPGSFTFDAGDSVIFSDSLDNSFESMSTTFTTDNVFFFPDGRASSTGNFSAAKNYGSFEGTVSISVLAATGRIKVDSLTY